MNLDRPLNAPLPFLTSLPGIGGELKSDPDDFLVEELPLYETLGEGSFVFLYVEKCGLTTPQLVQHIAGSLKISRDTIGTAGRKDRHAITRQFLSVPANAYKSPRQIETDHIRVLSARRHPHKLKTGHLAGNRFRIVLRNSVAGAFEIATQLAALIAVDGVPNYYGEQRFGNSGDTDETGFRLLRGEETPRLKKDDLRFKLSAVQSRLFNVWASERVAAGLAHKVQLGDVMQVAASGGCFVVEDVATEQARADRRETWISGPIYGPKMRHPTGLPGEHEQSILDRFHLSRDAFLTFKKLTLGTRRPLLVWPGELQVEAVENGIAFQFTLPAGAYATTLLREFQKFEPSVTSEPAQPECRDDTDSVTVVTAASEHAAVEHAAVEHAAVEVASGEGVSGEGERSSSAESEPALQSVSESRSESDSPSPPSHGDC